MSAGCERLVHPSVDGESRARQRRLLGVLLAGPFVLAAAIAQTVMPALGAAAALAALCAAFGGSWLIALYTATRGRFEMPAAAAFGWASILVGATIALSGGAAAPTALLLLALPVEAYWVSRSGKAAFAAAAAGIAALLLAGPAIGHGGDIAATAGAWQWISPLLYMATMATRWLADDAGPRSRSDGAPGIPDQNLDAVVARLSRNGEVESISPMARAMLEIEPDLLLAGGLFERIHVADRVSFLCAVSQVREEAGPRHCEIRIRMPATGDGGGFHRPFQVEIVNAGTGDETVVAIIRDAREIDSLRRELTQAREAASATEVAKGRFLAAVSHELRTPLNAIIGFSDMLLHREISGDLAPKQAEHVSLIREAGNHLLSVVNAILDVSKIEAGAYQINVEPFDPEAAVELCRAMLLPQAEAKRVSLSVQLPLGLGDIVGDQRAFHQILINLLSNAIKFTPEGGSVSVSASRTGNTARIFVSDTGIGISGDDLSKLGKPFMQVQNDYTRQFQGTGLGLSLVKGLVTLHGGSMSIESAPGLGTTVAIGLPVADRVAAPERAGYDVRPMTQGETGKIDGTALRKIA